ncbi:putative thioesterase [Fusarium austroafricanum]|uniref:Putative thioesterase n=1 Tax=Fusarium austroafricanum TaxID=2364996 RepID=A0A8H4KFX7_9HYPO|nr:putative thioesterase [Fusarium austroafricanum]
MSGSDKAFAPLKASAYFSPYHRSGAPSSPQSHDQDDPYASLRAKALTTLEAMGFEPKTMVERGVTWAEDQDPFGHVAHSQYLHFFGICWLRVMESYDEFLSKEEYEAMMKGKTVIPVVHQYEIKLKQQVRYPDSLIVANREEKFEPSRNIGTTVLFSLQQQAIVAQVTGYVTFISPKTGRPIDIRTICEAEDFFDTTQDGVTSERLVFNMSKIFKSYQSIVSFDLAPMRVVYPALHKCAAYKNPDPNKLSNESLETIANFHCDFNSRQADRLT